MRTNVLNDLSNVVKKGTILAGSAAAAVDSCAAGSTTLAEYPGNNPVITQLSPRNHPLWDAIWKHVAMIFAVLVMSVANIGTAWGAYDVPANGTVTFATKVNNEGRFNVEASGVYHFRSSNYSWDSGIKTQSNNSGVIFYLNASTEIEVGIKHTESKNAHNVTVHVYSIPESEYKQFDDHKAEAAESGRTFSTGPSTSSDDSFTISVTAETKTFTGTKTLAAGYYAVVPVGEKSKTFFTSIKFTSGGGSCTNVGISTQPTSPVAATVGSACSITGLVASGTSPSYQWYTCNSDGSSATAINAAGSLSFTGYQTATLGLTPTAAGTTYYKCVVSGSCGDPVTSNVVAVNATAQYTVTYNLNGGKYNGSSDAPTQSAVTSGTSITMPVLAPTKSGYAFTGWRSSVNSNDYMPSASYTMTAANTTFTAQWATACFEVPDARKNSDLAATITASMLKGNKIAGGTLTWENAADYTGNGTHGLILNEDGEQIVVTLNEGAFVAGSIITITTHGNSGTSKTCGVKVSGNNMTPATYSTESTGYRPFSQTYVVQAGDGIVGTNTFAIKRYNSNQVYIYSITVSGCGAPSCTAPNHVDISGRWDRFGGETISLTATAYSSAGTGSPITSGITGYQWQKLIGSTWTNVANGGNISGATAANLVITNCTKDNSGKYRCVVSTGATCSTASATATDGSQGFGVKVYVLECYTGGTTEHHFTRTGDSQAGTLTMNLTANTAYTFKVHADNTYYGNNGTINKDETNWVMCNSDNGDDCAKNLTVNSGLGGTFTFGIEYSTSGSSSVEGEPEISVTYPRKTIYLVPNSDWLSNSAKFAFHYYGTSGTGWTDFLTSNDCGMSAEIPQWNGLNVIAVRFNPSDATPGWNGDGHVWNQTADIAATADKNCVTITDWNAGTYGTYSTPTYTISYNAGTGGSGSKASESKTCGVDFTLPGSTFTYAGHTQDGWATTDGGTIAYALSGSYTTNDDEEFFPHWKCNTPTITDNGDNTVAITVPSGTTVRYTTDGSTPTSSTGTVYSSAFTIDATVTVKAIAYQSGCTDSEVASQECTYHAPVEGCIDANSTNFGAGNSSGDASKTLADGTVVAMNKCTNSASSVSIGGNILFTAPTGKAFETFSFVATCGSAGKTNYYKINGGSQQSLESSTTTAKTYTITIPGATNATTIQIIKNGTTPAVSSFCYTLKDICTSPTTAFANGAYTVGGSALDLSTLISGKQGSGTITYTVKNANGTGAAIDGSNFTATSAGTATVTATQAANGGYCEKVMDATITVSAAGPSGDCITITNFATTNSSNTLNVYKGTISDANKYLGKTTNSNTVGKNSGADLLLKYKSSITIYNAPAAETNFTNITEIHFDVKANDNTKRSGFEVYVGATKVATISGGDGGNTVFNKDSYTTLDVTGLEQLTGYVRITSTSSSGAAGYDTYIDNIQICTSSLDACTTPALPDLSKQTVCEGSNGTSWNAAITNSGSLVSGETVAYSWVKKGSSTVLSSVATYQPTSVTEAMAGTYVVTATVSADGKASKSASKEVELAVNATVEISGVTQSPATVYTGNSVTLTATANVSATWQWYTCTNAEGDGESSIGGATSATYAFAAPASAGTYYYKVKATGPCGGVATEVYALTISAATGGDCDTYYFFANAADATTNSVTQNEESFFSGASEGTNNNSTSITVDENSLSISKRTSAGAYSVVFTVSTGATATLYTNAKANNTSYPLIITRSSDSEVMEITNSTTLANYTLADIPEGTWTLSSGSGKNWYYGAIIVKVCTGATCTDPAVTASVSKSNVCVGSGEGVTFTASDAHASATYKWQKQNGSAWEDISGATAATYTITTVEASHAGKYRVVASHECDRISNELILTVATTPVFGDLGGAREVETGGSLSITNVEATSATSYKWYKSANATYDSGSDEQVGTSKNLMLPVSETAGSTFYLFCVASNACTSTVSNAITVSVIAPVEKDCAVAASNGENFTTAKTSNVNSGTYNSQTELHMNNNNKYIYYVAATGYHFETATVNCCAGDATALTKAAYGYSTDGGATWTDADLPGAMTNQYSNHVVNLPADVNAFRIGRVLGDHGVGSNTLYVHEVCFTYVADCNATTIAISNATPSYDLSVGGDFTEPTCTVKQGGTTLSPQPALRYSSFNEAIATVDPSTGEVDFTGTAGLVMIMASYDGDETYCESSATYTITVSCGSESAPKIVAGSGTNLSGCNAEVNLVVKDQNGNDFASGSYQWYRDGEEIDGATSATYTANRTGTYTVSHTGVCTQMSTNSAVVTSESFDPSVERLVPFQYYHANKNYTDQMKMRHLFAVTSGGDYEGKRYYMTATRNGAPLDITTSTAFSVRTSIDNRVDSVMIDLNKLNGKFNAGDEIVLTCAAIADCGTISAVTENIEIHVIDNTPTLALICSGTNKSAGTRKTSEMTVGGDFLTGYNKADLCEQTGNTSFDANTEWGLYTRLKENYIVTPVNGYAVFNKLNYEPFDILLLTDYPKASKSTEAALILDDMYELCDYRPMLSFKTHMVQPADKLDGRESHWKKKGFTTQPEVPKQSRLRLNIVCYAHPMFEEITEGVANDYDDESQIVYTMLSGPGHEGSKGMQGFHLAAAENFVTIGLVHYNATATDNYDGSGNVKWTPGSGDEMLVAAAERQTNLEARFILFSLNCGAQSKLTAQGNTVVLKCLEYLLNDATIEGNVADCALTFDNKAGDHKWSNKANWAPKYSAIPGEYNSTRIAAPATVDLPHAKVMSVRIKEGGSIYIPAGSALDVKSTVRHKDVGSDVRPTDVDEIHIGSSASGNGTLIFNNNTGDTKARVDMYSNAPADMENMSAATSTWQYIGTPHTDVTNARSNYYGSWLYQYSGSGWEVIPNGGPLVPFRGYCITNETAPIVYDMEGTLAATTTQDIAIPAGYTVIANSWVAPIDINAITDDDMEGIKDKTIYFFNTGNDVEGDNGTGTEAGTYRATPIHSASYTGDWQIPSMQGFYVSAESAGTLHLDYDRHVRPSTDRSILSGRMYAPRRAKAAEEEEPAVLKIFARGSRYQDKLVVLEREDFTRGYDSGWDGEAWGGGTLSPMVYVTGEGREDAVSAIPEFEGTVIAFKAGEDNDYRFDFIYDGEESLYLFDTENNTYTQIMTGESYYFSTDDKAPHSRFILTRRGPQIATGVGEVPSDQVQGTKAKKLLIENKMYILLNGALYDATGKAVK